MSFGRNIHNQRDIKYIKNIKRYPHVAKAIQLKHCTIIWNLNSFILSIFLKFCFEALFQFHYRIFR